MLTGLFVFGVTLAAFLLVIVAMAVGVMVGRREISGSCGGLGGKAAGESGASCSLCENPAAACSELRQKMQNNPSNGSENMEIGGRQSFDDCDKDCVEEGCSKEAIDACKGQ